MLARSKSTALRYTKDPYLICKSESPNEEIYFVPDSALPALNVKCDPLSLVTQQELYALKKRYRVPNSLIKRIQACYKKNEEEFQLPEDVSLESSLFISSLEDIILSRLKNQYRNESANFLPHWPVAELGVRTYHCLCVGASSSGKSWITSRILAKNFPQTTIYVFSPTATRDKAWTDLRKELGNGVKLINSNEVQVEIPLEELDKGCCLVVDDIDATSMPSKNYIAALQARMLYEGRHWAKNGIGCCVFSIVHDAFSTSNIAKSSSVIESSRIIVFPNLNKSITTKFLQKRLHWSAKEIKKAYSFIKKNDRWACIFCHVPNLLCTKHGVLLL